MTTLHSIIVSPPERLSGLGQIHPPEKTRTEVTKFHPPEESSRRGPDLPNCQKSLKIVKNCQKPTCWNLRMSVLILVSNGAIQRSNRICSQDQHADLGHISLGQQPILATMSWNVRNIWPTLTKISPEFVKISPKHPKSTCWNLGMSVLILASNGAWAQQQDM